MKSGFFVFIFLLLLSIFYSGSVKVLSPYSTEVKEGGMIVVGAIGPGQTAEIWIDPKVSTGGIHGIGGRYDLAYAKDLPKGWKGEKSQLYGNPLQVRVTAPPEAQEGAYYMNITVIDEGNGEQLGNITFTLKVYVKHDVLSISANPKKVITGPGQPKLIRVSIENTGLANDAFHFKLSGRKKWEFEKDVFVPAKSKRDVVFEIFEDEEEKYDLTVEVVSLSSPIVRKNLTISFEFRPTITGDLKALNRGTVVFPLFESFYYGFLGLLSNIFP